MLTAEQHREFAQTGLVRLAGAIPPRDVQLMCERIWRDLERRYAIRPDAPDSWTVERPSGFNHLARSGAFAPMGSPAVCDALDDLFGPGGWQPPEYWSGVLVTFPSRAEREWNVPNIMWHLDLPAGAVGGVRVFAFLSAVEPAGGGTVAVAGSHRVVQRLIARAGAAGKQRSADVRDALVREYPWFEALCSRDRSAARVRRLMLDGDMIDGVPVRVVELTGAAGDVVLMHLGIMHSLAPNHRATPRIMLGQQIYASAGGSLAGLAER